MSAQLVIQYVCPGCGYQNIWTRDEILERGKKQIFRDPKSKEDYYSLACKNPAGPRCSERYIVAVYQPED